MRFFRFMAVTVLLLACVALGSACAGAKGEQGIQGPKGEIGATGATGPAGPAGIAWEGEWSSATTYGMDDAVGYQGSSYISKQNGNTNHVPSDTAWWDLLVAKGATGATGATGGQGLQGPAGPNLIVAMGVVNYDGGLAQGYNVFSSAWVTDPYPCYKITLTDRPYSLNYVTIVSPYFNTMAYHVYNMSADGALLVVMWDTNYTKCGFSFMVLDATP